MSQMRRGPTRDGNVCACVCARARARVCVRVLNMTESLIIAVVNIDRKCGDV